MELITNSFICKDTVSLHCCGSLENRLLSILHKIYITVGSNKYIPEDTDIIL